MYTICSVLIHRQYSCLGGFLSERSSMKIKRQLSICTHTHTYTHRTRIFIPAMQNFYVWRRTADIGNRDLRVEIANWMKWNEIYAKIRLWIEKCAKCGENWNVLCALNRVHRSHTHTHIMRLGTRSTGSIKYLKGRVKVRKSRKSARTQNKISSEHCLLVIYLFIVLYRWINVISF